MHCLFNTHIFIAAQVAAGVEPDLVIFVMDSSIGQAAQDQAAAFKDSVQVRSTGFCQNSVQAQVPGFLCRRQYSCCTVRIASD